MNFVKYQGAGNDFVIIDNRNDFFDSKNKEYIKKLCDRNFGVGADGLILLQHDDSVDFRMVYFNSDGKESSMCGNGGRCIVSFAKYLNVFEGIECTFRAIDGLHKARCYSSRVELKMNDINLIEKIEDSFYLDTGSPHFVAFKHDLVSLDLVTEARKIRYNKRFSLEGTNVNFVEPFNDYLSVRTYERGVENETLACGTGVTAVALVAEIKGLNQTPNTSKILTKGGNLEVVFERKGEGFENIWLKGPAELVFTGSI